MNTVELKESYFQVERLIEKVVSKFHAKNGGEREELLAEAKLHWVAGMQRFDSTRSKLSTWSWIVIWQGLSRYSQQQAKKRMLPTPERFDIEEKRDNGFLKSLVFDVSNDARIILEMILDTPVHFQAQSKKAVKSIRGLKRQLQGMGWSAYRIAETFNEVRGALS